MKVANNFVTTILGGGTLGVHDITVQNTQIEQLNYISWIHLFLNRFGFLVTNNLIANAGLTIQALNELCPYNTIVNNNISADLGGM